MTNNYAQLMDEVARRSCDINDSFASLEEQNRTIARIKDTDVVFGIDTESGNRFLVYGRPLVRDIAASEYGTERRVRIVAFRLRQSTNELEMLLAAVEVAKGHHEYLSYQEALDVQ